MRIFVWWIRGFKLSHFRGTASWFLLNTVVFSWQGTTFTWLLILCPPSFTICLALVNLYQSWSVFFSVEENDILTTALCHLLVINVISLSFIFSQMSVTLVFFHSMKQAPNKHLLLCTNLKMINPQKIVYSCQIPHTLQFLSLLTLLLFLLHFTRRL